MKPRKKSFKTLKGLLGQVEGYLTAEMMKNHRAYFKDRLSQLRPISRGGG